MLIDDDDLPPPLQYRIQRHWDESADRWGYRPSPLVLIDPDDYWIRAESLIPWVVALNLGASPEELMANGGTSQSRLESYFLQRLGSYQPVSPQYLEISRQLLANIETVEAPDADR